MVTQSINHSYNIMKIIGHRGNQKDSPENTLEAFRQCLADPRVDGIELDVWWASSLLPVIHDEDVSVTTAGSGLITSMTDSQIKALQCRFEGKTTAEHVPFLDEVLHMVAESRRQNFTVNVEMKANPQDGDTNEIKEKSMERCLAQVLRQYLQLDFVVSCFDHRRVVNMKKLMPQLPVGILMEGILVLNTFENYSQEYGFAWWNLHYSSVSPSVVQAARKVNAKVAAWTVDDPKEWDRLINACQIDAIITNRPLNLAAYLHR